MASGNEVRPFSLRAASVLVLAGATMVAATILGCASMGSRMPQLHMPQVHMPQIHNPFARASAASRPTAAPTQLAAAAPIAAPSAAETPAPMPIATPAALPTEAALTVASAPTEGDSIDRVVATVDGDPITMRDVIEFAASTGNPVSPDSAGSSEAAKAALKALIESKLLEQEVKKYEDKVDEGEVDRYIAAIRNQKHLNDEQFRAALIQNGISYEDFRKRARMEVEKMAMIDKEVRDKIVIPPADIQAYYNAHRDDFTIKSERLKIAQVLVALPENPTAAQVAAAKKKADSIRNRALHGEDFGGLARRYSDDASKTNRGELGWFAPGDINDAILTATRSLKPGELSPVVRTKFGFHVLRLEDHEVPGVRPLADVREEIRQKLQDERAQDSLQTWVDTELVKQHYVQTNL
jgi:parvulin-like peptidyl-prolyl isomerase